VSKVVDEKFADKLSALCVSLIKKMKRFDTEFYDQISLLERIKPKKQKEGQELLTKIIDISTRNFGSKSHRNQNQSALRTVKSKLIVSNVRSKIKRMQSDNLYILKRKNPAHFQEGSHRLLTHRSYNRSSSLKNITLNKKSDNNDLKVRPKTYMKTKPKIIKNAQIK
jgi:hypothetical protein